MANFFQTLLNRVLVLLGCFVEILINCLFGLIYRKRGDSMPPIRNVLLLESAASLARKIRQRKISSVDVLKIFIARIEEVNPKLNCVIANRFEDAMREAQEVDDFFTNNPNVDQVKLQEEKPFFGVPFTTKDCIAIKDMIHSSGLWVRRNIVAEKDADSIALMRKAGAIPIALTNVSELCMWWESHNYVHGRTNNPYDTNRIVGGSSGGEGCAQACCASAFGIGSDIGGSIRIPAFVNGVFGHKPSKFIVSTLGQYPRPVTKEQESFLGIGPLCRRAEDLLPILKVIAGPNKEKLNLDQPVDLKQIRFFYQENNCKAKFVSAVSKDIREAFRKVILHLDQAHKIKAERKQFKEFAQSLEIWMNNMRNESEFFKEQLSNLNGSINIPWEFLKWFAGCSKHTFIALCTALAEDLEPSYGSATHRHFVELRDRFRRDLEDLLGDDGVLLFPTHPTAALYHNEPVFKPFNFVYTGIVNALALPATHVPLGLDSNGLPIGIQVIANDRCDRLCLAVAVELEKAFGGWTPPPIEA